MTIFDYFILFLLSTAFASVIFWLGPYERWAARKHDEAQVARIMEWMKSYNEIRDWHLARSLQENDHEADSKL